MTQHSHSLPFIKQLFRKPHQVVALSPSSPALGDRLISTLDPKKGTVIELGAGTGSVTDRLLAKGFTEQQLILNELNPEFCSLLYARYPKAHVFCGSAEEIANYTLEPVQGVVSGLPILSFPYELQKTILEGAFSLMGPTGKFLQLTHGITHPIKARVMQELGLTARSLGREYRNFPPVKCFEIVNAAN